jgi:outer membrane protein assembly factor BamB
MYSTGEPVQTWPVFVAGKIIFNAGNSLYILNAADGNEIRKVTYPSESTSGLSREDFAFNDSYVAVSAGIAYYAALNGDLVAVDMKKGEIIWSVIPKNREAVASGINYWAGKLYYTDCAGSLCCKIYCIDANSGDVLWSSFSHDPTTWLSGGSVSVGNMLYTCTSDEHTMVAFDKNTGEFLRIYPTETNAYTPPLLHGEDIIVAATDVYSFKKSYIMEFDTKNHTKLWQASLEDCVLSSPAIYQGIVYFGTDSGVIYSIAQ